MGSVTEISIDTTIERALAGDREACGEIFDGLAPRVRRFLLGLRLPLESQDVNDALQETFLRLFRGLPKFDASRSLEAYALGIARFVAIDLIRRAPPQAAGDISQAQGEEPASQAASRLERRELIAAALAALDPELRTVIALRHQSGLKMEELAECLEVSAPTARARVREASHCFAIELRQRGLVPQEVCA